MEESAEAQEKVCMIHYKQMEKADRDPKHALRAEEECRLLLVTFPNSKFAPQAQQYLRDIQEVLGQREFVVGSMYHHKGSFPAAANRLQYLTDQYPLYSAADEALMKLGESYGKMGPRMADRSAAAYTKLVKDYPLSQYADAARAKLEEMERPIPEADPVALARMKYERDNRIKQGILGKTFGLLSHSPNVNLAAKQGSPAMETLQPSTPVSVPTQAPAAAAGVTGDVTIQPVTDSTALDKGEDARAKKPGDATAEPAKPDDAATTAAPATNSKKQSKKKK